MTNVSLYGSLRNNGSSCCGMYLQYLFRAKDLLAREVQDVQLQHPVAKQSYKGDYCDRHNFSSKQSYNPVLDIFPDLLDFPVLAWFHNSNWEKESSSTCTDTKQKETEMQTSESNN